MRVLSTCAGLGLLALTPSLAFAQGPGAAPTLPPDQDPEVFVKKGIALNQKGDLNAALDAFNKALQLDPHSASAYENRGDVRLAQGELTDAIGDFTQALRIQPDDEKAAYRRAVAEVRKGDLTGALGDLNHAIDLHPQSFEAYLERGQVKYAQGDAEGAIADLNQCLLITPGSGPALFDRGLAQQAQGKNEQAASDFQDAAQAKMGRGALWYWIAKVQAQQRDEAAAALPNLLAKALAGHPDPWLAELGDYLLEKTTDTQLLADGQKGQPGENRPAEAWFFVGLSRNFSSDRKGAQEAFRQALIVGDKTSYLAVEARRRLAKSPSP